MRAERKEDASGFTMRCGFGSVMLLLAPPIVTFELPGFAVAGFAVAGFAFAGFGTTGNGPFPVPVPGCAVPAGTVEGEVVADLGEEGAFGRDPCAALPESAAGAGTTAPSDTVLPAV
jgi:hypothetical protein